MTNVIKPEKKSNLWSDIMKQDLLPWLTELVSVSFFINLLALATPLFVLQVYDKVVFKASITTLQGLVIGMVFVILFDFILKITRTRFLQSVAARNDMVLSEKIFSNLFNLPLKKIEEKELWHWQSLFQDAQLIRNVLSGAPATLIIDLPFSLLFLLVISIIAPPLWWIFLIAIILFITMTLLAQRIVSHRTKQEHLHGSTKDKLLADLLKHRESVNTMALQAHWSSIWIDKQKNSIEASIHRGKAVDFFRTLSQSMMLILTVTITSFGALAILQQEMTIGTLIAANMLGSRLIQPFVQLVEQWRTLIQSRDAIKRLNQFLEFPQNKMDSATDIPEGSGQLSFNDLSLHIPLSRDQQLMVLMVKSVPMAYIC